MQYDLNKTANSYFDQNHTFFFGGGGLLLKKIKKNWKNTGTSYNHNDTTINFIKVINIIQKV